MVDEEEQTSLKVNLGETKICLAVLCGLPGAGKTSLAVSVKETRKHVPYQKMVQEMGELIVLHLCYDEVIPRQLQIEMIRQDDASASSAPSTDHCTTTPWKTYRQAIVNCVDCILEKLHCSQILNLPEFLIYIERLVRCQELSQIAREVWTKILSMFQDQLMVKSNKAGISSSAQTKPLPTFSIVFLIDDNMFYRSMRYQYYQVARKHCTGFCQIYLHCSSDEAIARNSQRCHGVQIETIINMASKIEAPKQQTTSWERNVLQVIAEDIHKETTISTVWDVIGQALMDPMAPLQVENTEEKVACRAVCAANVIHQVDQTLRRSVAKAMAAAKDNAMLTKSELKTLGAKLNAVRQHLLQQVRECKIVPPSLVVIETSNSIPMGRDVSLANEGRSNFEMFINKLFDKQQKES